MQDGYINENGEYRTEEPGWLESPVLVRDSDDDYSETVASSVERLVIYGRTSSELWNDAVEAMSSPDFWWDFGRGFVSYPDDIRWFLVGTAAWSGVLGPNAKRKADLTTAKVVELFTEVMDNSETPGRAMKSALIFNTYANYILTVGAGGFAGRLAGGAFTTTLGLILARSVGLGPFLPQNFIDKITNVTLPMLLVVTTGSMVRVADKHFDKYGHLGNLDTSDLIVSALTGDDEAHWSNPMRSSAGADIARRLESLIWGCERDIREARGIEFTDLRANEGFREDYRVLQSEGWAIESALRYPSDDEEFYDALIKAHNFAIRLKQMGCSSADLEYIILLGDPTVMQALRTFLVSIKAVFQSWAGNYEFWQYVLQERARFADINNPDNTD